MNSSASSELNAAPRVAYSEEKESKGVVVREAMPTYLKELIAGGVAGGFAKSAVAPLERIKILFQTRLGNFQNLGVWRSLLCIFRTEGIPGFYRGNGAAMLRIVPYAALHFMTYEQYRRWLCEKYPSTGPSVHLFAGSLAGGTAVLCTYPLDLARTRLAYQTTTTPALLGVKHVFTTLYRESGTRGLYRGLGPTLAGILPYAGLKFYVYERLKGCLPKEQEESLYAKLACGAAAGLVGQTFTYPLDVVRRQMQVQSGGVGEKKFYRGTIDGLRCVIGSQGWRQMFAGVSINYIKIVPSVAIGFAVYDGMKQWLRVPSTRS